MIGKSAVILGEEHLFIRDNDESARIPITLCLVIDWLELHFGVIFVAKIVVNIVRWQAEALLEIERRASLPANVTIICHLEVAILGGWPKGVILFVVDNNERVVDWRACDSKVVGRACTKRPVTTVANKDIMKVRED
ncbi:hypothetical protein MUP59_05235, partial [Candidatus Bathyarchaeota archaeon]|nr:hypothetical protein [Candidatus Bathyarchaeota archaeon]